MAPTYTRGATPPDEGRGLGRDLDLPDVRQGARDHLAVDGVGDLDLAGAHAEDAEPEHVGQVVLEDVGARLSTI
jgi:hypothetical protein